MATTIKVSEELRDRLAALACAENETLAGAITRALDAAEDARFWQQVSATMTPARSARDAGVLAPSLADGLDPEESWDDVWPPA